MILEQYKSQITSQEILGEIKDYKRRKLEELDRLRDATEKGKSTKDARNEAERTNEEYMAKMQHTNKNKKEHVKGRDELSGIVSNLLDKQKVTTVEIGGRG